jgi:hypothetical protein
MPQRPNHYGTLEYIEEMDRILDTLRDLRKYMGRGERKERFTISRAMESIKHLQGKAKRHGIRIGLIDEVDDV